MKVDLDFRLLDISLELSALEQHLELIGQQLSDLERQERLLLNAKHHAEQLTPDDPDWHINHQEYQHRVNFLLPHFFNGPFLISLYAVLESAVTDVADQIQEKKGEKLSIDDLRGSFLNRAKKYYKNVLRFDLYNSQENWQRVQMLADIRHALAHTNGRFEMMNDGTQEKIRGWVEKGHSISVRSGFLIPEEDFLQETFEMVQAMLSGLTKRYKEWESNYSA